MRRALGEPAPYRQACQLGCEIGAAGEWALPSGASSFGPSAAIEFTPNKDLLEIELGVSPMFSRSQAEYDTELVFKTPLPLGLPDNVEVMLGGGRRGRIQWVAGKLPTPLALRRSWIFSFGNYRRESSAGL
jgi:hypothetical protein